MRTISLLFIVTLFSFNIYAQKIIEKFQSPQGHLRIGNEPERIIPMVERGFSLILPEEDVVIQGVVIVAGSRRFNVKEAAGKDSTIENEALKKNLAVLYVFSGNPLDFYFTNSVLQNITGMIQSALKENNLDNKPVFFSGLSLAGTRALRLAVFLQKNKDEYWLQPSAAAVIDAPLDMVRFWDIENRALKNNFHPDAVDEGRWVTYLLKQNLGTPEENFDKYVDYSPFVYTAEDGGNVKYLINIPVRAYHQPDVDWWIENRRKDYYSMNSVDLAGLINQLKLLHNTRSELITARTRKDNFIVDSSPHTDTFVDYAELMDWFLSFKK
jgi:hypothetical protein